MDRNVADGTGPNGQPTPAEDHDQEPYLPDVQVPGNPTNKNEADEEDLRQEVGENAITQEEKRPGGLTAQPTKRKKKFGKASPQGGERSPLGGTAQTAMQLMNVSQGGNPQQLQVVHNQLANSFSMSNQALPFSAADLQSRGGVPPSTLNMMNELNPQAQASSLHSIGGGKQPPTKNQINIVAKKRPPSMPIKNHGEHGIDPKRKVLYRNFHDVDGVIYLVEISRNALKVFILLFPNFEAPDIFLCESMAEKKA